MKLLFETMANPLNGGTGIQAGGKVEFPLGRRQADGAGMGLWEEVAAAL